MVSFSSSKQKAFTLSASLFAAAMVLGLAGEIGTVSAEEAGQGTLYHHRHHRHHKIYPRIYPHYGYYGFDFGVDDYGRRYDSRHYYDHDNYNYGQPCVVGPMGSSHPVC